MSLDSSTLSITSDSDGVHLSIRIPVDVTTAWKYLTAPASVARWWGDHVQLNAVAGGQLREKWSNGQREVLTTGTVTRCEPPTTLGMTWADDDWPGDTNVCFQLAADGAATRVELVHEGFEALFGAAAASTVEAHATGWRCHLQRFIQYVDAAD